MNIQIEKSNVVAPFSGAVSQRLLDEGAYLAPGSHVLTLTSARVNELVVALPATIARQLTHQKDYQFTFSKKPITARWHSTYPAVDSLTQTRKVKFVIDGNETIVAGEYLELQWPLTIEKEGFWLPNSALIKGRKGLWEVFIVDSQKRAVKHNVDVLYTERDRSYVSANFSEDALVVDSGTHRLTNHTPVVFQNSETISSTTNSSTTDSSTTNSSTANSSTRITQHLPIGVTDNDA
ncbi:efflux RND transporter periplasmic adaptor subunit [Pleionea litopenaei]|uniref:HlyD family efflux transporter periplasmic adaptor subunit n=1 Tax=Pleionea litopenaei TaxID=3070815 RepID=A0AA51RRN9_9GAMM|nr:HlyD family efflux transporter periplasmic adaptor subunit [Pleionea sp. HL-JVS1]WMS86264.1 HlyD family efflux transporter periplasmic adaptor subunit [Pleionea sp. HL-JVS1]